MQHVENKADTFAQSDKADHDGQHNGEQADDLVEDAAEHLAGYDGAESGGSSLQNHPFIKMCFQALECLGSGFLIRTRVSGRRARYPTIRPTRDINAQKNILRNL